MSITAQETSILESIARDYGLTPSDILGRSRWTEIVRARHAFWLRLRELGHSYPQIARVSGHDHCTVLAAIRHLRPEPASGLVACDWEDLAELLPREVA